MRDSWGDWDTTGARVFGVSRDSKHSHKAWKEHLGLSYSLLADLVGDVAKEYGAWNDALHRADRTTIAIDPQGIVRYVIHNNGGTARDHNEALEVVRSMSVAT